MDVRFGLQLHSHSQHRLKRKPTSIANVFLRAKKHIHKLPIIRDRPNTTLFLLIQLCSPLSEQPAHDKQYVIEQDR